MKKSGLFLISLMVLILSLGVLSCEVGLGQQVDVQPPKVSIESPEVGSVIRDDFAIRGRWTDDGSVDKVRCVLTRTDKLGGSIPVDGVANNDGTWNVVVNAKTKNIVDGEYLATLTLIDNGAHETEVTRTFIIDNTPPIVVLERPSSILSDENSFDNYGKMVVLKGEAADDNKVAQINIDFYADKESLNNPEAKPAVSVVQYNVPNTIDLDIATWDGVENSDYSKLYGSTTGNDTRCKYYKFTAYDGAQRYPIEGEQKEADKLGNPANKYYLRKNTKIAELMDVKRAKLPDIYEILNGVYDLKHPTSRTASGNPAYTKDDVLTVLNNEDNILYGSGLKLNPFNNPTYNIPGRNQLCKENSYFDDPLLEVSNGESSTISIELATGLDNIAFQEKENFKFTATPAEVVDGIVEKKGEPVTFSPNAIKLIPSGLNYNVIITPSKNDVALDTSTNYILEVTAPDIKGNPIVAKGPGLGFGFRYTRLNVQSGITITKITRNTDEASINYFTKNDTLYVHGQIDYSEKIEDLVLKYQLGTGSAEVEVKNPFTKKPEMANIYTFKFPIKVGDKLSSAAENGIDIICNLYQRDSKGDLGKPFVDKQRLYYDISDPTLEIETPGSNEYTSTNMEIEGRVSDDGIGIQDISYTLSKSGKESIIGTINSETPDTEGGIKGRKYSIKNIDLSKFGEGKINISVTASDKLGNKTAISHNFYHDISTPTAVLEGGTEFITNKQITLKGSVSDTDELNDIYLKIVGLGKDYTNKDTVVKNVVSNNKKEAKWELQLSPSSSKDTVSNGIKLDDGTYNITLEGYDIAGRHNKAIEAKIIMDTVEPTGVASVTTVPTSTKESISWYDTNSIGIKVEKVSDKGSGIKSVVATVYDKDENLIKDLKPVTLSLENNNYIGTVTTKDGKNIIKVAITDIAGNIHVCEPLTIYSDTQKPEIKDVKYFIGTEELTEEKISSTPIGGTKKNILKISFTANDANGISSKNAYFADKDGKKIEDILLTINKNNEISFDTLTIGSTSKKKLNGFVTLKFSVSDPAGQTTEKAVQLNIDNTPPVVDVSEPQSSKDSGNEKYLAGAVDARGSVDSLATLKYVISNKNEQPSKDIFTEVLSNNQTSWTLKFDSKTSAEGEINTVHSKSLTDWIKEFKPEIDLTTYKDITTLYLWIMAEDELGNISYKSWPMVIDPQGDRPEIVVSNPPITPENPIASASGSLSFFGSVIDTIGVNLGGKNIYMQLISDGHREKLNEDNKNKNQPDYCEYTDEKNIPTPSAEKFVLTKEDMLFMKEAFPKDKLVNMRTDAEWKDSDTNYSDFGIKINVASNGTWNKEINANDKFNAQGKKNINVVGARFFAKDNDNKISTGHILNVKFDSSKPVISDLKLVNGKKVLAYTPNMYISGKEGWKLTGTITDNDKVASIRVKNKDIEGQEPEQLIKVPDDKQASVNFEYVISTGTDAGTINLLLDACDATSGRNTIEQLISINVDNLAPVISYKGESGYAIVPEENKKNIIRQKNSFFTFGSRVTEDTVGTANQSGFAYVAAYFKRDGYIINPLLSRTDGGVSDEGNYTSENYTLGDDGLYWRTFTVTKGEKVTIDGVEKYKITIKGTDKNIHSNGLVKINNAYYLISNNGVADSVITIDGVLTETPATAEFANAFIINNSIQETGKLNAELNSDGYYAANEVINDDGDRMIEVAKKTGSRWDWEASICSKNIPDGAVELHYVVFDNAGNYTIGTETKAANNSFVDAYVMNNGPRIAGVIVKTDYDSGKSDPWTTVINKHSISKNRAMYVTGKGVINTGKDEFDPDKTVINKVNKEPLPTTVAFGENEPLAALGGQTLIIPEIVGGNGEIYYSFDFNNGKYKGNNVTTPLIESGTYDYTVNVNNGITVQYGDLLQISKSDETITPETSVPFKFTFYDSTYGTKIGNGGADRFTENSGSQTADMTLYFTLKGIGGAPILKVKDFYWNSKYDNSLFKNSAKEGHIELVSNLSNELKTKYGNDPKLSGKVKIEGTAIADSGLGDISIKLPNGTKDGNTVTIRNFNTASSDSIGNFSIKNIKKDGDKVVSVDWTYVWDTESVSGTKVGLDQNFSVSASNKGTPSCETSTSKNTKFKYLSVDGKTYYADPTYSGDKATSNSGDKQVDVVPYIVGFSHGSPIARARSGAYAVTLNDTGLTFNGFNIPASTEVDSPVKAYIQDKNNNKTHYNVTLGAGGKCTVPETAKDGSFVVSVKNGTDWIEAINSYNDNTALYNKEDDVASGGKGLSDDRYVHVWRVNDGDIFQGSKDCFDPTMAKDPKDGTLMAAFSDGGLGRIFTSSSYTNAELLKTGFSGPAGVTKIYDYSFKPSNIDMCISRSRVGGEKDISVAYGAVYKASKFDYWNAPHSSYKQENSGGMYIYDNNNTMLPTAGGNDGKYEHVWRGQLYSYDKYLDQFANMRVARNGDYIYTAYFDKANKSVNFSSVRTSRNGKNYGSELPIGKAGTEGYVASQDQVVPWISIDGGKQMELLDNDAFGQWKDKTTGGVSANAAYYKPLLRRYFYWEGHGAEDKETNVQVGTPFNLDFAKTTNGIKTRTTEVGEYVGLTLTKSGMPVIVYVDSKTGGLRIARSSSVSGTLGYLESQYVNGKPYNVWKDDLGKGNVANKPDITGSTNGIKDVNRSAEWGVYTVSSDGMSDFGEAYGSLVCEIDPKDNLHIIYTVKNNGTMVYLKSKSYDETNGYTFEPAVEIDNFVSNIDLSIMKNGENYVPYISYIKNGNTVNGMKVAFPYDLNGDKKIDSGEFEVMIAPSNEIVKDVKTCIETDVTDKDKNKHNAAVGVYNGFDYRVLYYVGESKNE